MTIPKVASVHQDSRAMEPIPVKVISNYFPKFGWIILASCEWQTQKELLLAADYCRIPECASRCREQIACLSLYAPLDLKSNGPNFSIFFLKKKTPFEIWAVGYKIQRPIERQAACLSLENKQAICSPRCNTSISSGYELFCKHLTYIVLFFLIWLFYRCGWVQREVGLPVPRVQMQKYMGQLWLQLQWQLVLHAGKWHVYRWGFF